MGKKKRRDRAGLFRSCGQIRNGHLRGSDRAVDYSAWYAF